MTIGTYRNLPWVMSRQEQENNKFKNSRHIEERHIKEALSLLFNQTMMSSHSFYEDIIYQGCHYSHRMLMFTEENREQSGLSSVAFANKRRPSRIVLANLSRVF